MMFVITFEGPYNKATRRFAELEATVEGDFLHGCTGHEVSVVRDGEQVAYFSHVRAVRQQEVTIYTVASSALDWGNGIGRGN